MNRKVSIVALIVILAFLLSGCADNNSIVDPNDFWDYLAYGMAWIINFWAKLFGDKLFFGIIFGTLTIRTLAWPVYSQMNKITLKMALIQPEMQKIEEKYAGKRDPESMQRKNQEMAKMYGDLGVMKSILGCIPSMVLQMLLFSTMYRVVIALADPAANIGDFAGLDPEFLFFNLQGGYHFFFDLDAFILLGGVGLTMYLLQKITQKKPSYVRESKVVNAQQLQQQKTQKLMSYFMVGMMVVFAAASNALALYWIAGNFHSMANTTVNRKINENAYAKHKSEGK